MQFASKGQWGSGLYFAREAGYSDIYASKGRKMPPGTTDMAPDESEMMLASLLLGDVIELDRDNDTTMGGHIPGIRKYCNDLKVPPHKSATPSRKKPEDGVDVATAAPGITSGARYNTVRGYTQTDKPPAHAGGKWTKNETCPRSQVWIVYENGRACERHGALCLLSALQLLMGCGRCFGRPEVPRPLLPVRVSHNAPRVLRSSG